MLLRKILSYSKSPSTMAAAAAGAAGSSMAAGLTGREMADMISQPLPLETETQVRLTDTGYFITGKPGLAGRRMSCRANMKGNIVSNDITFTPGPEGHFVYTGYRPNSVSIRVLSGAAGGASLGGREDERDSEDSGEDSSDGFDSDDSSAPPPLPQQEHRSFPSAY